METIVPQLRRTAWHEAGHIVVAHALGWTLGDAWISAADWAGSSQAAPPAGVSLRDRLTVLYAGDLGAALSGIDEGHEQAPLGDMADVINLVEAAIPDDEAAQDQERWAAEKIARDLLDQHRPIVERIAEALLRSPDHALSGDQIAALLVYRPKERLSKTERRQWLARLSAFQTPGEMKEHVRALKRLFRERLLIRSGFDFYRDAATAADFAAARRASRVRLWPGDRPDFEMETEVGIQQFEVVEADTEGRKRGKEYEEILPQLDAGELVVEHVDEGDFLTSGQAEKMLRRAAEEKARKGYDPTIGLVIRLNPGDFDFDHDAIVACMETATEPASGAFVEVWVLWKGAAYPLWKAGKAVGRP